MLLCRKIVTVRAGEALPFLQGGKNRDERGNTMSYHERNAAAEVMNSEIAATRIFFSKLNAGLNAIKNSILRRMTLGTEAEAKIKAQRPQVMHDLNYPDVGSVRQS